MLPKNILLICFMICFMLNVLAAATANAGLVRGETLKKNELEQDFSSGKNIKLLECAFQAVKSVHNFSSPVEIKGRVLLNKEKAEAPEFTWTNESPNYFRLHSAGTKAESFDSPTATDDKGFISQEEWSTSIIGPVIAWMAMDFEKISRSYMVFRVTPSIYKLMPKGFQDSNLESITIQVNDKKLVEHVVLVEKSKDEIRLSFSDPHIQMKQ